MNAIYDFLDNRLSPTLVRDIRQLVRNRFITVMLNLYVLILTLITLAAITFQSARTQLEGTGEGLYATDLIFFFLFTFIVVNLYTAVMMSQERITNDLMFTTTIPPSGFVFGKLSSALVLAGMLFCVTLPFITIAYMLRGIDLQTILQTCFLVILMLGFSLSMTILIFSRVKTYVMMIGLLILYAILCWSGVFGFIGILVSFLGARWGGIIGTAPGLWQLAIGGVFVIMTALVILTAAMSRVASTNTNRIMPFRITYTVYMLLTLGASFAITAYYSHAVMSLDALPLFMVFFHYGFFLLLIVISTCGRDNWGLRLKRTIPQNLILRCLLFPFYSGAINGMVWLLGIACVLVGCFFAAAHISSSPMLSNFDDARETLKYGFTWVVMAYAFCTLAMMIRIKFLKRYLTPENTWLLALAIFGGFYATYFTIQFLLTDDRARYGFYLEADSIERTLFIAALWALLASILFVPWALRQLPMFTPEDVNQNRDGNGADKSEPQT